MPDMPSSYEDKYLFIAGIDKAGHLKIISRRSVCMYHPLGQELENFHLVLHKQFKITDALKAQSPLDMNTGHVELQSNRVKAQTINADLASLTINDAEVVASVDIEIAAEFLHIARRSAAKINLQAGQDIGLKAGHFVGNAASLKAGHALATLFVQSENRAQPIYTSNGSVMHLGQGRI